LVKPPESNVKRTHEEKTSCLEDINKRKRWQEIIKERLWKETGD
jgi:hypothetical protein